MDTTNAFLSDDSKAILLICSDIVVKYVKNVDLKPLTVAEWNKISKKLLDSSMKSPKAFFDTTVDDWRAHLDISQDEAERIENLLKQSAYLGFELERLAYMGIWVTTRAEKTYPPALKSKLKYKSPVVLYCSGNPDLFEEEGIAIVGSRNVDEDGMNFAQVVARKCANERLTVISGGAKGVDTIAQMAALSSDGTVISVLADSMEKVVRRRELRDAIIENKLLIVSPFNPECTFKIYNAMDRNKYIYALSKAAIVVSSDYGKGLSSTFKSSFDGTIVGEDFFKEGDEDFNVFWNKIKGMSNVDAVFIPGYATELALIIKQARDNTTITFNSCSLFISYPLV